MAQINVISEVLKEIPKSLIIVLDIETTGLTPACDMICEIGICQLNLETGQVDPIFSQICQEKNKEFGEYSWVFQNSDLTIEDVINAPYFSEFQSELQNMFDLNIPIAAYNQEFDFGFLEYRGLKIRNKFWDPMLKLTPILKIPGYYGKYKWPSVQEAWNFFNGKHNYKEGHRALDDAMHEAQIIYETNKYFENKKRKSNNNKAAKGFMHTCGHFCADTSNKAYCCRCQNPNNGYIFKPISMICEICKKVMKKYADGFYFQECPVCGKKTQTTDNRGLPVAAPLSSCSDECSEKKEKENVKN